MDLISRDEAIDLLLAKGMITAAIYVERMPSAEKTATWEPITKLRDACQCSNCKKFKVWSFMTYDIHYCPECGARMVDDEH